MLCRAFGCTHSCDVTIHDVLWGTQTSAFYGVQLSARLMYKLLSCHLLHLVMNMFVEVSYWWTVFYQLPLVLFDYAFHERRHSSQTNENTTVVVDVNTHCYHIFSLDDETHRKYESFVDIFPAHDRNAAVDFRVDFNVVADVNNAVGFDAKHNKMR